MYIDVYLSAQLYRGNQAELCSGFSLTKKQFMVIDPYMYIASFGSS